MIKKFIHFLKSDLRERLLAAFVFSIAFTVIGVGYPILHYTYIDKTDFVYFGDKEGIKTNKLITNKAAYKAGEAVTLSAFRYSKIERPAIGVRELKLINLETGRLTEVQKVETKGILDYSPKGEYVSFVIADMPTNIPKGRYFYKGVITYNLRSFVDKTVTWQSSEFTIE